MHRGFTTNGRRLGLTAAATIVAGCSAPNPLFGQADGDTTSSESATGLSDGRDDGQLDDGTRTGGADAATTAVGSGDDDVGDDGETSGSDETGAASNCETVDVHVQEDTFLRWRGEHNDGSCALPAGGTGPVGVNCADLNFGATPEQWVGPVTVDGKFSGGVSYYAFRLEDYWREDCSIKQLELILQFSADNQRERASKLNVYQFRAHEDFAWQAGDEDAGQVMGNTGSTFAELAPGEPWPDGFEAALNPLPIGGKSVPSTGRGILEATIMLSEAFTRKFASGPNALPNGFAVSGESVVGSDIVLQSMESGELAPVLRISWAPKQ